MKAAFRTIGLMFAVTLAVQSLRCIPPVFAQDVPPPTAVEVDTDEVFRRGNLTVKINGYMSDIDMAATGAYGPPADDSHKWFITILADESPESKQLLSDIANKPELRAWVSVEKPKESWSHFNVYYSKDKTQSFRWSHIKVDRLPVVLLQPPRNWDFGNPATVVLQRSGYTEPSQLSKDLSQAIYAYTTKLAREGRLALHREDLPAGFARPSKPTDKKRGYEAGPSSSEETAPTGGFGQVPFAPPGPNERSPFNPIDILPRVTINPAQPQAQPQPTPEANPLSLIGLALSSLTTGQGFGNLLLLGLLGVQTFRSVRQARGQKLLLDDSTFDAIKRIVQGLSGTNPPKAS